MADLKIDYDLLSESSSSLGTIYHALDTLKSRRSQTESDWGSSAISDALGSFAGDWDSHREKIMKSVQSTKGLVDEALEGFKDTEGKLASSLRQSKTQKVVRAR
jgi:hypothetical protein